MWKTLWVPYFCLNWDAESNWSLGNKINTVIRFVFKEDAFFRKIDSLFNGVGNASFTFCWEFSEKIYLINNICVDFLENLLFQERWKCIKYILTLKLFLFFLILQVFVIFSDLILKQHIESSLVHFIIYSLHHLIIKFFLCFLVFYNLTDLWKRICKYIRCNHSHQHHKCLFFFWIIKTVLLFT